MPQSRKRKTRRGGGASRATYSKKNQSSKKNAFIAAGIVAALAIAIIVFLALRGSGGRVGDEITTASGLKYVDEVVGTGANPATGKTVSVHYTGTLLNGTKFDSSVDKGQPLEFRLGVDPMIQGWSEGLMTMKVGGKRRLIVPPDLGYGAVSKPKIPANSTLIFEIELLNVK